MPPLDSQRPPIILGRTDADRLSALAIQMEPVSSQAANLLLDEIERAEVRPDDLAPADVVAMGSTGDFLDESNGTMLTVQLVYPVQADIAAGRISVLTPVGAGLFGMAAGHSILWPNRDGRERPLHILRVTPPRADAAIAKATEQSIYRDTI